MHTKPEMSLNLCKELQKSKKMTMSGYYEIRMNIEGQKKFKSEERARM
jgi:hypothetical protein